MKIIYLCTRLKSSGGAHYVSPFYYLKLSGANISKIETERHVKQTFFEKIRNTLRVLRNIRMHGNQSNTILYIQGRENLFYAVVFKIYRGVEFIYHTQDFGRVPSLINRHIEKLALTIAREVIVNDQTRALAMQFLYNLKRPIKVIPTWLEPEYLLQIQNSEKFSKNRNIRNELNLASSVKLIFAGGPAIRKRASNLLIEAIEYFDDDVVLIFTDRESQEDQQINLSKINSKRIKTINFSNHEELIFYIKQMNVCVLLYSGEDLGSFCQSPGRLSEYCSQGVPFIFSNFPSLIKLCSNIGSAFPVENTVESVRDGIQSALRAESSLDTAGVYLRRVEEVQRMYKDVLNCLD